MMFGLDAAAVVAGAVEIMSALDAALDRAVGIDVGAHGIGNGIRSILERS